MAEPELASVRPKSRVVIIDDEAAFSDLLTKMIRGLGHEVMVSTDPRSSRAYELR